MSIYIYIYIYLSLSLSLHIYIYVITEPAVALLQARSILISLTCIKWARPPGIFELLQGHIHHVVRYEHVFEKDVSFNMASTNVRVLCGAQFYCMLQLLFTTLRYNFTTCYNLLHVTIVQFYYMLHFTLLFTTLRDADLEC